MGQSLFAFVIVLGVLIFFHELGHFLVARFCGVGVETFSLGFGPKVYKRRVGFTQYCLSAIPLGGYVKMVGEEPGTELSPEEQKLSFTHKSLWQKIFIVAAGPLFNFLLAILIFYLIFQFTGLYLIKPLVGEVGKDTPAFAAGIRSGDMIHQIQGEPVTSWDDLALSVQKSRGKELAVEIVRNGHLSTVTVTPEVKKSKNLFGEDVDRYMIGISAAGEVFHKPLGPLGAMYHGLAKTWEIVDLTFKSVVKMIQGSVSADNMGGPIMIAQMAGEQARAGITNFLFFIGLLSVNLGILNLFPIPVLDGGHILFFALEGITGRTVRQSFREKANKMGMALLVALMVFVFYNDLLRLFKGG